MAAKDDMTIPLLPDRLYHIYNRGIAKQPIFYTQENFRYFMEKYSQKMTGYFDTFGYCLLENHFHFFVRVVDKDKLLAKATDDFIFVNQSFYKDYALPWVRRMKLDDVAQTTDLTNFKNLLNLYAQHGEVQEDASNHPPDLKQSSFVEQLCSWVVSERFRGFLLGYAKAINKQESRTGSLLQKGFRRKFVPNNHHDKKCVLSYIHHNPIHHFYTDSFENYNWSSYNSFLSNSNTRLCRSESLEWFGSVEDFKKFSEHYKSMKKSFDWIIDED